MAKSMHTMHSYEFVFVVLLALVGGFVAVAGQEDIAPRRLRRNNDIWHRLSTTTSERELVEPVPINEGSTFVDLLRQTTPQYVMQEHSNAFDEMLTRAFSDITEGLSLMLERSSSPTPKPTLVPSTPETSVAPSMPIVLPKDDIAMTSEGVPVDIRALDNDSSVIPLQLGGFTQPLNGNVTLNPDGVTLKYTPRNGYSNCPDSTQCKPTIPLDCFSYTTCTEENFCVSASVCVEVAAASPRPIDDEITTKEGASVVIDALANDVSVEASAGEPLRVAGTLRLGNMTQPQNGNVSVDFDSNTITYLPSTGYSNCPNATTCNPTIPSDCFQYQACRSDRIGICTWANVCVEVIPRAPTSAPTVTTTFSPTANPMSAPPTSTPTMIPTVPCGISKERRAEEILFTLLDVSSPTLLSDVSTPQGNAFRWLVDEDKMYICPSENPCDVIQRYILAVMYFSTNGDNWFQCSGNPLASDTCGDDFPFDNGESRFLAPVSECDWAGIKCSDNLCVTEIEFELNNLVGTMPNELGQLSSLQVLGMERGGLSSTIPSSLGKLTNLYFLDLDYNALTGSVPSELSNLSELEQFDVNDNRLTGTVEFLGVLTNVFFLQLHNNNFSGTLPESIGTFANLGAATLHGNSFTGTVSSSICSLRSTFGGPLLTLTADCDPPENPEVVCTCCSECRNA